MQCSKTVSPKKIEANRQNGKRSSGPRTERGKLAARFNAVTLGLFAKHVVIPICDGHEAERDFQSLLNSMHEDLRPVGIYEEWLVLKNYRVQVATSAITLLLGIWSTPLS
jgi:hypothetical protein